jgi:hypothetical protein
MDIVLIDFASQNQSKRCPFERLWGCVKSIPPPTAAEESFE